MLGDGIRMLGDGSFLSEALRVSSGVYGPGLSNGDMGIVHGDLTPNSPSFFSY